jgi:hypothetical protein
MLGSRNYSQFEGFEEVQQIIQNSRSFTAFGNSASPVYKAMEYSSVPLSARIF